MATTGGKVRLLLPVDFADEIVSIGDLDTYSNVPRSTVLGSGATAQAPSPALAASASVVIGASASSINSDSVIVIGDSATISTDVTIGGVSQAISSIVVGAGTILATTGRNNSHQLAIGPDIASTDGNYLTSVLGDGALVTRAFQSLVIGQGAANGYAGSSVVIGRLAFSTIDPQVGDVQAANVVIGTQAQTLTSTSVVAIGYDSGISASSFTVVIGSLASAHGSANSVIIGKSSVLYTSANSVILGMESSIGDDSGPGVVIGLSAGIGPVAWSSVVLGSRSYAAFNSFGSVIVGYQSTLTDYSFNSVLIGYASRVTLVPGAPWVIGAVVIGDDAVVNSTANSISIGYGTQSTGQALVFGSDDVTPSSCLTGTGIAFGNQAIIQGPSQNLAVVFGNSSVASNCYQTTIIGTSSVATGLPFSLVMGYGNTVTDSTAFASHVVVGAGNTVGDGTDGTSVFGQSNIVSHTAESTIIGRGNTLSSGFFNIVFGNDNSIDSINYSLLIGERLSVSSYATITLGFDAVNTVPNTMVVGSDSHPIHTMVVNGYNGGAILTVAASDHPPVDGQTGLTVTYNNGSSVVNRDVFISDTPPPGAIVLYMAGLPS